MLHIGSIFFPLKIAHVSIENNSGHLTLKAPISTAADNKFCHIFPNLAKKNKIGMIFHENCQPADDSHEISCLICFFLKRRQNLKLSSAANYRLHFKGYLRKNSKIKLCLYVNFLKWSNFDAANIKWLSVTRKEGENNPSCFCP